MLKSVHFIHIQRQTSSIGFHTSKQCHGKTLSLGTWAVGTRFENFDKQPQLNPLRLRAAKLVATWANVTTNQQTVTSPTPQRGNKGSLLSQQLATTPSAVCLPALRGCARCRRSYRLGEILSDHWWCGGYCAVVTRDHFLRTLIRLKMRITSFLSIFWFAERWHWKRLVVRCFKRC